MNDRKNTPGKNPEQAAEQVILSAQSLERAERDDQFPLYFRLNWGLLRPYVKRISPSGVQRLVQRGRALMQPSLLQYAPHPLTLSPTSLTPVPLPDAENLPAVSIVTPSFNQAPFLERSIKSVISQDYPKLEYIIMDGASHDGSARILSDYEGRVSFIESKQDAGQAHAINKGFRRTSGEIMAWLNSDDFLLPHAIPCVVKYFLDHPEVDVVYGLRVTVDEEDREIGRWIIAPQAEEVLPWANYLPQEAVFWRRRIWEKVGGTLDESYHFDLDWDLWLRFYQAGARFVRLPRFLGAFRFHDEQKTASQAELGRQEAQRLHRQYHGRSVQWLEIRYQVRRYLARCSWYYLLYYLGGLRY